MRRRCEKSIKTNANLKNTDLGASDLTNANLKNAKIQNSYFKNSKMDGVVLDGASIDSCFKQDILSRLICKINFELNPNSPPYETNYEFRDNYVLRN